MSLSKDCKQPTVNYFAVELYMAATFLDLTKSCAPDQFLFAVLQSYKDTLSDTNEPMRMDLYLQTFNSSNSIALTSHAARSSPVELVLRSEGKIQRQSQLNIR